MILRFWKTCDGIYHKRKPSPVQSRESQSNVRLEAQKTLVSKQVRKHSIAGLLIIVSRAAVATADRIVGSG